MHKEEFTFDSRDGKTKLYAYRYIPDGEVKCILQIVHGMAEHIGRYEEVAEWFAQRGFLVTAEDHLGHGKSVPEGGTYGYFCPQDPATVVVRDVHRLKKMTQEAYPGVPYVIWGHSMGSFILRNYMIRYGSGIDAAIVCGTATKPAGAIKSGLLLASVQGLFMGDKHIGKMLNTISFGNNKNIPVENRNDWLSTDHNVAVKYDADPKCGFTFTINGFKTMFTLIDRQNNHKNVALMPKDLPIYLISGKEDIVGDCGVGVCKVYEEYKTIGMKDVEMKLYDGLRHEIHNEPCRVQVYEDILSFISKRVDLS